MSDDPSSRQKRDRDGENEGAMSVVPGAGSIASLMQQSGGGGGGGHVYTAIPSSAATGGGGSGGAAGGGAKSSEPRKAGGANMFSSKSKSQKKKEFYKKKGAKETARVQTQIASGVRLAPKPVSATTAGTTTDADGDEAAATTAEAAAADAGTCIFDRAHGWHCVWQQLWKDCNRSTGNNNASKNDNGDGDEDADDVLADSYTFNQGQISKACYKCGSYSTDKFMVWCNRFFHKQNRYNRVFDIVNTTLEFHTTDGSWSWVEVEWTKILEKLYHGFEDSETGELLEAVSIKNLRAKTGLDLQDEHFMTGCLATVGRKQDNIPTHHNICLGVDAEDRSSRSLKAFLKAHGGEDMRRSRCKTVWISRPAIEGGGASAGGGTAAPLKLKKGVQEKDLAIIKAKQEAAAAAAAAGEGDAAPTAAARGGGGKQRSLQRIVTKIFKELQVTPGRQLYWNPVVAPTPKPVKGRKIDETEEDKKKKEDADKKLAAAAAAKSMELSFLKQLGVTKEDFGLNPHVGALDPWFRLTGSVLVLVEQPSSGKMQFRQQEGLLACVNTTTAASDAKKKSMTSAYGSSNNYGEGNMFSGGEGMAPAPASLAFKGRKKTQTQTLQERARQVKTAKSKAEKKKATGHGSFKKVVWTPKPKIPGKEKGLPSVPRKNRVKLD